ncbi:hypothetical protein GGR54DRAFT_438143 [Hypoxylon sp. NC1633]|nr:hypothetical protein GGR54DRAFT_438143 [Hypoxylon sp. NC1633]
MKTQTATIDCSSRNLTLPEVKTSTIHFNFTPSQQQTSIMSNQLEIIVDPKEKTIEGHTRKGYLFFKGDKIWEDHCHDNTIELARAIQTADYRFALTLEDKPKSVEGHIASITVKRGNETILNKLNTHDNMTKLRDAVNRALRESS